MLEVGSRGNDAMRNETDIQFTYNVMSWRVRATICCTVKSKSITYSERVFVALSIQHSKRMSPIILSSETCPVLRGVS